MYEFIQNNSAFVIFIVVMSIFLYIKRSKLDIQGSFPVLYMVMYKTSLGLDKMDKWSKKHPRVFLYLAYLSLFIGIVGCVVVYFFMFWQIGFIVDNGLTTGGGLVLPIQTEKGLESAVPVFYVPFWYWIIALAILAIVHEFAHGVIAERFKVRIKSSGFAFLGILAPIIPAAFVEPDEKDLAKKPWWQKIAVFGAGSTSNFIFGTLFLLMWIFMAGPLIDKSMEIGQVSFTSVMNESSLHEKGVTSGKIISLNGETNNEKIVTILANLTPNQNLNLEIDHGGIMMMYDVTTFENSQIPGKGMIGISGVDFNLENKEGYSWLGTFPLQFERLLFWVWFLNIAIGIMNLLPLWITDGGQILRTLLTEKLPEKKALRIYNWISFTSLILIVITIWPKIIFSILGLF